MTVEDIKQLDHITAVENENGVVTITVDEGYWLVYDEQRPIYSDEMPQPTEDGEMPEREVIDTETVTFHITSICCDKDTNLFEYRVEKKSDK